MRQIDLDGEINEECKTDAASGLLALGMTVVEAMEKEAIGRMESSVLTPEEIERLETQLQVIELLRRDQGDLRGPPRGTRRMSKNQLFSLEFADRKHSDARLTGPWAPYSFTPTIGGKE